MIKLFCILAINTCIISATENDVSQNDLSDLKVITASECKETEWLKKGKCQSLTGIGEKFPNFPEVIIQSLREKMRDDYWNWEREKVPGFFQKILKKLKHAYALHTLRQSKGKLNCLKIDNVKDLKNRLKVLEFIYDKDLSTGRNDVNGTFQQIQYIHYFENYLENVNNLLFKSFINPYSAKSGEKGQRPIPCRVKLEIQKRIDKLFRYVEIHCRRMCPFLGWEGYNHVRSDDYIDYYQAVHPDMIDWVNKKHPNVLEGELRTAEDYPIDEYADYNLVYGERPDWQDFSWVQYPNFENLKN